MTSKATNGDDIGLNAVSTEAANCLKVFRHWNDRFEVFAEGRFEIETFLGGKQNMIAKAEGWLGNYYPPPSAYYTKSYQISWYLKAKYPTSFSAITSALSSPREVEFDLVEFDIKFIKRAEGVVVAVAPRLNAQFLAEIDDGKRMDSDGKPKCKLTIKSRDECTKVFELPSLAFRKLPNGDFRISILENGTWILEPYDFNFTIYFVPQSLAHSQTNP